MGNQHLLAAIVLIVASVTMLASSIAATSPNTTVNAAAATVYDILAQNNLPRGLLPLGVKSYALHAGGALEVTLPDECNFFVTVAGKQFKFRYGSSVGGIIKSGSISRVYGVRVQVEFAWLGFSQVQRAGDQLKLQLEGSVQSFPVSAFAQSPRCS